MTDFNYHCTFCHTRFKNEKRFLNHKCKQMKRDEEFKTAIGQTAWQHYQAWMKSYKRIVPHERSYLKSKYFNSFMRFAAFVKKMHIPDVQSFIWLMRDKDISPTLWTNDQVYTLYLEFVDRKVPPKKHAEITIDTLFNQAEEREIAVGNIFDHITPNELILLMRRRQISPWFLLNSQKFKHFFVNSMTAEEKMITESIIRPHYWKKKFEENAEEVNKMRLYAKELNL